MSAADRRKRQLAVARTRRRADRVLAELYERVPVMADCKGLCHDSCGPIPTTVRERERVGEAGVTLTPVYKALPLIENDPDWRCPALDADNRCTVYDVRPLICRLYGAVENMPCAHGCVPVGRYLTRDEAAELIATAEKLTGGLAR